MARRHPAQTVLLDSTETIETYPRVLAQATGSPTARVFSPGSGTASDAAFSATGVTLDDLTGDVETAAEEGDTALSVSIDQDVVRGRRYLIAPADGGVFDVLAAADSAADLDAATFDALFDGTAVGSDFHAEWFTLTDATGQSITFEWRTSGSPTAGRTAISIGAGNNATTVAQATADAINAVGATLRITAGNSTAISSPVVGFKIVLTQDDAGPAGNTDVVSGTANLLGEDAFAGGAANTVTVYLEDPLPQAVPVLSTFKGWRIARALTADETDQYSTSGAVVEFSAVLDGVTERWTERFDVVPRNDEYLLTSSLLEASSDYVQLAKSDDDKDFSETIDAAWRLFMEPALSLKAIEGFTIVSQRALVPAHVAACELYVSRQYGTIEDREDRKKHFTEQFNAVLGNPRFWVAPPAAPLTPPDPTAPPQFAVTLIDR